MRIDVDVREQKRTQILVVSIVGTIDIPTETILFRKRIEGFIAAGYRNLIIDIEELRWIDSAVFGELIIAKSMVAQAGGELVLVCSEEKQIKLLPGINFKQAFVTAENEARALQCFTSR